MIDILERIEESIKECKEEMEKNIPMNHLTAPLDTREGMYLAITEIMYLKALSELMYWYDMREAFGSEGVKPLWHKVKI